MQPQAAYQLPHPLNGVDIWSVGREVVEEEARGVLLAPSPMRLRVVILGIVGDEDDVPAADHTGGAQLLQDCLAGHGVEALGFATIDKAPVAQEHRAKLAHALAAREMLKARVLDLRGNPHSAFASASRDAENAPRPWPT